MTSNLRLGIQKKGRLSDESLRMLKSAGLEFFGQSEKLFMSCAGLDDGVDLFFVRDDDIPGFIESGVFDAGIVGENIVAEQSNDSLMVISRLGFGKCRLSIAVPKDRPFDGVESLNRKRIATSYPNILRRYLEANQLDAQIVLIKGAVEIAPTLEMADAVCDLVSTGGTLRTNGLKEVLRIMDSQAVLVSKNAPHPSLIRLRARFDAVLRARNTKYVMMNAPVNAITAIQKILPGMENPSITPLTGTQERVAIHAVASENIFWDTIERLKEVGATSILVLPIEKIIE